MGTLGRARLVCAPSNAISGPNKRTCLLNSILALLKTKDRELVCASVVTCMPAEGDMSLSKISSALSKYCILLKRVTGT